jgi:hypothetical protein
MLYYAFAFLAVISRASIGQIGFQSIDRMHVEFRPKGRRCRKQEWANADERTDRDGWREKLLGHGVRIDAADDAGHTPLLCTSNHGYVEIPKHLEQT